MYYTEQELTMIRKDIWKNAYELFNNYKNYQENPKSILKQQRKYINSFNIPYTKNKYKSIKYLEDFIKSPDKELGKQRFYNSIYIKVK